MFTHVLLAFNLRVLGQGIEDSNRNKLVGYIWEKKRHSLSPYAGGSSPVKLCNVDKVFSASRCSDRSLMISSIFLPCSTIWPLRRSTVAAHLQAVSRVPEGRRDICSLAGRAGEGRDICSLAARVGGCSVQPTQQGGIESNSRKIPEGLGDAQLSSRLGFRILSCVLGSVVLSPEHTSTIPSKIPSAFPLPRISCESESDCRALRPFDVDVEG